MDVDHAGQADHPPGGDAVQPGVDGRRPAAQTVQRLGTVGGNEMICVWRGAGRVVVEIGRQRIDGQKSEWTHERMDEWTGRQTGGHKTARRSHGYVEHWTGDRA